MSVTTIPILTDLQGAWSGLQVELVGKDTENTTVAIRDAYPFISVTDLKRLIWIQKGGDPRWAPERVFLGVRTAAGIRPIDFQWPASVTDGRIDLPDPTVGVSRLVNSALVDEAGNRKPVTAVMTGALLLETALRHDGVIPTVTAFSLASLMPTSPEELTSALFYGYYMLYFPWLTAPGQILDAASPTDALRDAYVAALTYTEDRAGRISDVQRALEAGSAGKTVTMSAMTRLRWSLIHSPPESLEQKFYGLHATETIPFIRFFPAGKGTPLLKIGVKKEDGLPYINDYRVFGQYLNQMAPVSSSAVILAKIPLVTEHSRRGTAFTLFMFENGMTDIVLEVPQRGLTYSSAVAVDAQRVLQSVLTELGYEPGTVPVLQDLHATYKWTHPESRRSAPMTAAKLQTRVSALTPFLRAVPLLPDEKALGAFQWKAVDNYEHESAQFDYITQLVLRSGDKKDNGIETYRTELSKQFGITLEAADNLIEKWLERRGEAVAPVAGDLAIAKHSVGASVTISGTHPEYSLSINGVHSLAELQRLVSVVGVLLGKTATIAPPAPVVQAMVEAVEADDAAIAEAGAGADTVEELDPQMALLMADLGFDQGEEGVEGDAEAEAEAETGPALVIQEVPAPVPDVTGEECHIDPIAPGEAPIKISADYYMARLKDADKVLFGYSSTATSRVKTYSKSCQRGDGRQPNVMTINEYASVKRCYENRVRFVDLPPNKLSDLPQMSADDLKSRVSDDYFLTDHTPGPTFGMPIWPIYGYESKETSGKFLYLICAELWCERDNLPLLRSEYEGTVGRGFTKKAMTCPFCGGKAIADMSRPASGETVIVREPKESTGKLHRYIGTITRNKHPNGYPLPCCDTTPRLLSKYMKSAAKGELVFEKKAGQNASEVAMTGKDKAVDYRKSLGSMTTQYILGNDKSLEAGKIGLLPPALDNFFGQNGMRSLESKGVRATFVDGAILFVRVGVDTHLRETGLNFFAGLAPLLDFNSAVACRAHILSRRMVLEFESANYGTLVHEFAANSKVTDAEAEASLQSSLIGEFKQVVNDVTRPHLVRLYKAWTTFLAEAGNTMTPKKLRHFEHLLAEPGCITPRGLLLVTLEQTGDEIHVVCPSFGIPTASHYRDVPVAFMWHDTRDESWEPLVLYNGTSQAVRFFDERSPDLELIPTHLQSALHKWLKDWRTASLGCGRPAPPPHVWTPKHDTTDLPRLSNIWRKIGPGVGKTLIRDRSNRLAGVLYEVGANTLFVPCLDDGFLAGDMPRLYEAESIPPAPVDAYRKFYAAIANDYRGLTITHLLFKATDKTEIVGFKTAVGTMVPTAPAPLTGSPMEQQVDEFPWERDALIIRSHLKSGLVNPVVEETTVSVTEQLMEAFQYVRLAMSNWLLKEDEGLVVRNSIMRIVESSQPLYERRKRMDILLEPHIRKWVSIEQTAEKRSLPILRKNCLSLPKGECSGEGGCSWVEGRGCLIHAPVENAEMDPVRIFTARLSDELLRYAVAKQEILQENDRSVQTIRIPRGAVRIGDELFMASTLKESSSAILERLGFTGKAPVSFPEEMLRFEGADVVVQEEDVGAGAGAGAGAEEEKAPEVKATEVKVPKATEVKVPEEKAIAGSLPESWRKLGLTIPNIPDDIEDAKRIALGSKIAIDIIDKSLKRNRVKMKIAGDSNRPFQWSIQDFYVIGNVLQTDVLFVHHDKTDKVVIDKWIKYQIVSSTPSVYMIFWGKRQLLVSSSTKYRFNLTELPEDLKSSLAAATPITKEEAIGSIQPLEGLVQEPASSALGMQEPVEEQVEESVEEPVEGLLDAVAASVSEALGLTQTQPAA